VGSHSADHGHRLPAIVSIAGRSLPLLFKQIHNITQAGGLLPRKIMELVSGRIWGKAISHGFYRLSSISYIFVTGVSSIWTLHVSHIFLSLNSGTGFLQLKEQVP
jgi:hypothetical protein